MRIVNIVIIGNKNGKHSARLLNLLGLSIFMGLLVGLGTGAFYYFLSGYWSHGVVLYGLCVGVGIIASGVIRGFNTPVEKLEKIE